MGMHEIGRIKQVQVQHSSLKIGAGPHRYYDPGPLMVVSSLLLTPGGCIGITEHGARLVDVHHADHAASHNHQNINAISLGFTSHYQTMRTQFGPHMQDGIAGENILVETDTMYTLADLEHGVAIQSTMTGKLAYLTNLVIAAPCEPFSQFAANNFMPLSNQQLKEALQFLHHGRRGFYAQLVTPPEGISVQAGDIAFAIAPA